MVAFLLITAVWSQLARLEAHQKGQGQAGEDTPPEKVVKLVVVVNGEGFNLVAGDDQQPIPKRGDSYDFEKLGTELKKFKDTHPDKTDIQVASEDAIKFDVWSGPWTRRSPPVSLTSHSSTPAAPGFKGERDAYSRTTRAPLQIGQARGRRGQARATPVARACTRR